MKHIFSKSFYLLFDIPNRKEVFETITNPKYIDKELSSKIKWNEECRVKVDVLYPDKVGHVLFPSIDLFLKHIGVKKSVKVKLLDIWKNTYNKDSFQEIHDHVDSESQFSGCIFLEDQTKDTSKFYFYNRDNTELTLWREIMNDERLGNKWWPDVKAGDIILFPSYLLHGVSPHKLRKPRTTISFNLQFI